MYGSSPRAIEHQSRILERQECIPVGCVPPATVAVGGVVSTRHPHGTRPPWDQTPQDQTPQDQAPPRNRHPLGASTPPGAGNPPGAGTTRGQTHTCKHITLPQTSFAGGNNTSEFNLEYLVEEKRCSVMMILTSHCLDSFNA